MMMLEVQNLTKQFGGLVAVAGVSFQVAEGLIFGIIGPNGAGKTTTFNLITGVLKPTSGRVLFRGKDTTSMATYRRAAKGLVRTYQTISLFHEMTALENVEVAHHLFRNSTRAGQFLASPGFLREKLKIRKRSSEILDYLGLGTVVNSLAGNLPHGHQRALGIAIALAADPKLLLLDEPVTGMDETETATMTKIIKGLRDDMGITIILVEHDMRTVTSLSDHIMVLNFGEKIAEGCPAEIVSNKDVIEAYLGTEESNPQCF